MATHKSNGLQVKQDDGEDITDWIRNFIADTDSKLCERIFEERCHFRMNSEMKAKSDYVRKCRGGLSFGEYMRQLVLEDIARFYKRRGGYKDADRRKD